MTMSRLLGQHIVAGGLNVIKVFQCVESSQGYFEQVAALPTTDRTILLSHSLHVGLYFGWGDNCFTFLMTPKMLKRRLKSDVFF
jgi:hypothetical protein